MGGFKKFLLRGNLIDLAVAVVIGGAFGRVITATVSDFITPIIGAFGKQPDFSRLAFTVNSSRFAYGNFLNVIISFVVIAAAIYFLVVVPITRASSKLQKPSDDSVKMRECPECLSMIPSAASRCMFCTAVSSPGTASE